MDKPLKSKDKIGLVKNRRWKIEKNSDKIGISKGNNLYVKGLSEDLGKINKALENFYKNELFKTGL